MVASQLVGDEGPERAMPLHRGEDQGMGTPQQEATLVGLQGQAINLTTPALPDRSGPGVGAPSCWPFPGSAHLLEGESCASRPPDGGRGEAIHPLAGRGTDQVGKAGEGRFEGCRIRVRTRHDRERAVILDGERIWGHGETPHWRTGTMLPAGIMPDLSGSRHSGGVALIVFQEPPNRSRHCTGP